MKTSRSDDRAQIIKQTVDIKQVVELYGIALNSRGVTHCPFHDDRHPSASISQGRFHCYVCGLHLDVFEFVRKMTGCTFPEALRQINDAFHVVDMESPVDHETVKRAKKEREKREKERADHRAEYDANVAEYRALMLWPMPTAEDVDGMGCYAASRGRLEQLDYYFETHRYER